MSEPTLAQKKALRWLYDHNGDGLFDKNGVFCAAGESAPHERKTWNALRDAECVEFYNPAGKGRGRMRITPKGQYIAAQVRAGV